MANRRPEAADLYRDLSEVEKESEFQFAVKCCEQMSLNKLRLARARLVDILKDESLPISHRSRIMIRGQVLQTTIETLECGGVRVLMTIKRVLCRDSLRGFNKITSLHHPSAAGGVAKQ
jgi:hypothetical protein